MPPHCDTLDGPVVSAGRDALEQGDVDVALPFVSADGEVAVRAAFELARKARIEGGAAREVADLYFFDTLVRVHRRGEGVSHTGLKPAGLDVGPVIPVAELAADTGDPADLLALLSEELEHHVVHRLEAFRALAEHAREGVPAARAATTARLGLLVWAHKVHTLLNAEVYEDGHSH